APVAPVEPISFTTTGANSAFLQVPPVVGPDLVSKTRAASVVLLTHIVTVWADAVPASPDSSRAAVAATASQVVFNRVRAFISPPRSSTSRFKRKAKKDAS